MGGVKGVTSCILITVGGVTPVTMSSLSRAGVVKSGRVGVAGVRMIMLIRTRLL